MKLFLYNSFYVLLRLKFLLHRLNPVETEMDEAIANVRSSQGHETFDDTYLTELCVKQKYMGHRNARYDPSILSSDNICQVQL